MSVPSALLSLCTHYSFVTLYVQYQAPVIAGAIICYHRHRLVSIWTTLLTFLCIHTGWCVHLSEVMCLQRLGDGERRITLCPITTLHWTARQSLFTRWVVCFITSLSPYQSLQKIWWTTIFSQHWYSPYVEEKTRVAITVCVTARLFSLTFDHWC